jgi:cell division protein FtsB
MLERTLSRLLSNSTLRRLALVGGMLLFAWVAFFDSHSVVRRVRWYSEVQRIEEENAALEAEIERYRLLLEAGLSDDEVERIARTRYGMQRPGEAVYRLQAEQ